MGSSTTGSALITVAGLVVTFAIGLITVLANRRATRDQTSLGLIDQVQEERDKAQARCAGLQADLDGMRGRLNDALDRIDLLLSQGRDQAHTIRDLRAENTRLQSGAPPP